MKRHGAAALFSLTLLASPASAEPPNWTIQVDPLTTVLGFAHLQVERAFGDRVSVYLGPSLRLYSPPFGEPEDYIGLGAEAGVRWYFLGGAPEGWWALARGVGAQVSTDAGVEREAAFGGYGSLLGGYTWILGEWFVLSAGAGAQYFSYTVGDLGLKGFAPALHTALGVAF